MAGEIDIDLANFTLIFIGEGNFSFTASLSALPNFTSLNCKLISTDYIPELKSLLECETTPNSSMENNTQPRTSRSFNTDLLKENVSILKSRQHKVFLDVDATRLHEHKEILNLLGGNNGNGKACKILVIFNFPHVKSKKMKIGLNRDLLRDFFISCDKVVHILNSEENNKNDFHPIYVIPIVSLCAGQSGIPEVESVSRNWGDSWQINDMAAHGNFVCTKITKFTDWNLASMIHSDSSSNQKSSFEKAYQSSYYRLQTGVSFATENALTLTYQHSCHVDPHKTDRLQTILRFNCESPVISEKNEIIADILRFFSPISGDSIIASQEDDHSPLHYHHVLNCKANTSKIVDYLQLKNFSSSEIHVEIVDENIQVKTTKEERVTIGKVPDNHNNDGDINMSIYLDQLLELKYNTEYRLLLCQAIAQGKLTSLYPHTHEFHISFWVNEDSKFSRDLFLKTLLDVYGLMLKSVHFVEEYQDKQGRKSLCWKIQVQSLDYPLSRLTAHQIYLQFRKELGERLNVEVR